MRYESDVLIVGSGIAGLSTAISAAEEGLSVVLLTKEEKVIECNTYYAQGGIVGAGEEDSIDLLSKDIFNAGSGINNREAVQLLASEGPELVVDFLQKKVGVPFCRDEDGNTAKTREAAHSVRRIYHIKDQSGKAIEESLLDYASKLPNIRFRTNSTAVEIITNSHNVNDSQEVYRQTKVLGMYVLDNAGGDVDIYFAPVLVLATGGLGNLFLHTSNPPGAIGDGVAMAYRAGVEVINAEYIQFHPTVFYHRDVKRFLITEAMRGEGAKLMNRRGEYFMERYLPEQRDLAPRDEVARAIYKEIENEGDGFVFLDTQCMKRVDLKARFPGIYRTLQNVGIDITKDPIPVVPAAHYFCGGIKTGLSGETSIPGLYAVGETACTGVHGANRLASVSLLEGVFFGYRAGKRIKNELTPVPKKLKDRTPDWIYPKEEEEFDPVLVNHDMLNIRMTMWNYAGIIRTRKRLARALADLNYLSHRIEKFYRGAHITREINELRNAVLTASIITKAADSNTHSVGAHYLRNGT